MDYRVTIMRSEWGEREIEAVYAIDETNRCWMMADADGDGAVDNCGQGVGKVCGERGEYTSVSCNERHSYWYDSARDHFERFIAPDHTKTWRLYAAKRADGVNSAHYSCGKGCQASYYDSGSDGLADEIRFVINLYSISFTGDLPDNTHLMIQRGIVTALSHFMGDEFAGELAAGIEALGEIALARALEFSYGSSMNSITHGGRLVAFRPSRVEEEESYSDSSSELSGDDLGVVPTPSVD